QGTLQTGNQVFASSAGIRRNMSYVTELGFADAAPPVSQRAAELQAILAAADTLPSRQRIQVAVEGPVVVLRGNIADEQERRLAEAVLRMTPGVFTVRNELVPGR